MVDEGLLTKFQPVMLVMERRLECHCGALAIFVVLDKTEEDGDHTQFDYGAYCQDCWQKDHEEED